MRRFISSLTISVALIFGLSQVAFSEELTKQQIEAIEKKAFAGNVEAQFNLGVLYGEGLGVRQDETKAVEWNEKAAVQGIAEAQVLLGAMNRPDFYRRFIASEK